MLVESLTDDTIELHIKTCNRGEGPLIRKTCMLYKKWQLEDDDSDITGRLV